MRALVEDEQKGHRVYVSDDVCDNRNSGGHCMGHTTLKKTQ
jgi:hypothetical protein